MDGAYLRALADVHDFCAADYDMRASASRSSWAAAAPRLGGLAFEYPPKPAATPRVLTGHKNSG